MGVRRPKFLPYKKIQNPGLGEMLSFLILSSECLQWRWRTERCLTLSEKVCELAAENTVYPSGSVFVRGDNSLE